jgi:hypothetical protein
MEDTPAALVTAAEAMTDEQKQAFIPNTLEVDSFQPSDSSGVALPDGEVAWNETLGGWVRHNGTTIGGILLVPQDPWYSKGAKIVLGSTMASDQLVELTRFPLTSAQAAVGKRFRLSGSYCLSFNGTRPVECYVGVVPELSAADGVSIIYGADHSGNTLKVVKSDIVWEFIFDDAGGGQYFISAFAHGGGEARLTGTTSSVVLLDAGSVYTAASEFGTAGAAQDLIFQLQTSATISAMTAMIAWDLRLEQTL